MFLRAETLHNLAMYFARQSRGAGRASLFGWLYKWLHDERFHDARECEDAAGRYKDILGAD